MPLDGEQLNDLLSGFVDGELTESERARVEKAAQGDARIGEQMERLRQQSIWVRQAGNALINAAPELSRSKPNGQQLAERVIHEAKRRGREMGLPASHYLKPMTEFDESASVRAAGQADLVRPREAHVDGGAGRQTRRRSVGWIAICGLVSAAAVLVAVTWSRWQPGERDQPPSHFALDQATVGSLDGLANAAPEAGTSTEPSDEMESIDETMSQLAAAGAGLVGKSSGMAFALVVDVEVTATAQRNHVLEKILATSGIPSAPPVAANSEIRKALDGSRMIVRHPSSTTRQLSIQVVRGDMREIDNALRKVWQDSEHFPNVALNLSIDSRATLMREILRSAGNRFTPTDRFAMPLAVDPSATGAELSGHAAPAPGQASPFPGADDGRVQYISKSQREDGWQGMGELSGPQFDSMVTILLVTHSVE